jgi:hypothetical protein
MGDDTSQFQVGVRDGPRRVRERDEILLDGQWEWLAPEDRSMPHSGKATRGGRGGW